MSSYDVVIIGGGPAGQSAALILARARKRVLLCDGGTPRNAAAAHMNGFVSRDGTPPPEFRRVAEEQLGKYPNAEVRRGLVSAITGDVGAFRVELGGEELVAKRVILCTGMIDDLPALPGLREVWGASAFQCPYCHGWEIRDQPIGCWLPATSPMPMVMSFEWALFLLSWSRDLIVFTDGKVEVPPEIRARFQAEGVLLEERPLARLHPGADGKHLAEIELADGARVPRRALFVRPPQTHVPLVRSLGLELDDFGYVKLRDAMTRATSRPGIYAAGDLTTMQQGALLGAAAGAQVAYSLNHALSMEALGGSLVGSLPGSAGHGAKPPASARARGETSE